MVDECAGSGVAQWLNMLEHDVISIHPDNRGLDDISILQWAVAENRILITCDKDFGELVFRQGQTHDGIVLLRLEDETTNSKIAVLRHLLEQLAHLLEGNFVVTTESKVRITEPTSLRARAVGLESPGNPGNPDTCKAQGIS